MANKWGVKEVDGHSIQELNDTFDSIPFEKGKPNVIIAHTIKGKGIVRFEGTVESHYTSIKSDEVDSVLEGLSNN